MTKNQAIQEVDWLRAKLEAAEATLAEANRMLDWLLDGTVIDGDRVASWIFDDAGLLCPDGEEDSHTATLTYGRAAIRAAREKR